MGSVGARRMMMIWIYDDTLMDGVTEKYGIRWGMI